MITKDTIIATYPVALGLPITMVLETSGLFDNIKNSSGLYLSGIMVMWITTMITYYAFIKEKKEKINVR